LQVKECAHPAITAPGTFLALIQPTSSHTHHLSL
jgi:hypothetical protein